MPGGFDTVLVVDFGAQYAQLIARLRVTPGVANPANPANPAAAANSASTANGTAAPVRLDSEKSQVEGG